MFRALLIVLCLTLPASGLSAQENDLLPQNVIFVTSTGFWEESGGALQRDADSNQDAGEKSAIPGGQRGYYKLIALRQSDGTAQIHLQQIASSPTGPEVVSSAELEEFTALKPYVTDIRPETSTGITPQPGMFATVYLKTDPGATEPESWTVLIDELGDIKIERATN
ncbi:hypothetical protein GOL30_19450 [Sinorhizobium medicae]|uniref:hypothetical protein n=1 Tax=Sinorhizobium medicae TaxID=110321 RepID=UPI0003F70B2E|nr:hypothetical protein [Sinorhizobium medicae]MDX0431405.1 hypothetical protein [Sinorhizobium medicae]MDX0444081.1 hypothetical protein [Sinorhizobium medicae]MDX0460976.1 hypothetical protein [Sinorhizobium medicae]MDX0535627.1 hypothetical protein [Sinorhizobium medicae]MDX0572103.1 hypothetical protein [Sinorhizobium medicae]